MSALSTEILERTPFQTFAPDEDALAVRARIVRATLAHVAALTDPASADRLGDVGLSQLHTVLAPEKLPELRRRLSAELSLPLFQWAARVCRSRLGFTGEFFLDEKIYFRVNPPFEAASRGPKPSTEQPKLRTRLRMLRDPAQLREHVTNAVRGKGFRPTLDLLEYNRNRPRATWAHGPHIDTWYGHAYGSINFWWAIAGVNERNSMVLFPTAHKHSFPFEPENMYLAAGVRTPPPQSLAMADGELALFDAELLHSTRLNTSNETRFVITVRANANLPTFSDRTTHAIYDLWHRASDIEAGSLRPLRLGQRCARQPYPAYPNEPLPRRAYPTRFTAHQRVELGPTDGFGSLTVLQFENVDLLLVQTDGTFFVTHSTCPHVGRSLADGHLVDGKLQCPAHGLQFDPKTGESGCKSLRLRTYPVELRDGSVWLNVPDAQSAAAE